MFRSAASQESKTKDKISSPQRNQPPTSLSHNRHVFFEAGSLRSGGPGRAECLHRPRADTSHTSFSRSASSTSPPL